MKLSLMLGAYGIALFSLYLQSQIEYSAHLADIQMIAVLACTLMAMFYLFVKQSLVGLIFFIPAYALSAWSGTTAFLGIGFGISQALGGG